eukprot:CAMPEP_0198233060 /NCGR_PEP_ID=MMETSP1445-20131203/116048_1 /TAXON_ID=36898 /ORGANISM="Pyramimonas sp., Strain CCMP2087" /LENGTH=393 /DNA_ID=CAMNT_0043913749 /DNA_START=1 /DNA_END=1183 /DNA_ORIENTATION=-
MACWRVQGKFTYKVDMVNFPFDTQTFEIVLEDESDGFGADYCFLNAVSGLSSNIKNTAESLTWQFVVQSKCYPPYNSCINGTESACAGLQQSRSKSSLESECAAWESGFSLFIMVLASHLLRYFLVPFFSLFIMLSTYALDPVENLNPRYTVSAGLLISTILFHVNSVMKATSHTSHLSYFDLMMVLTYVVNAVTVQFNVAIFLIDRWITRLDLKHNTEAFRSLQHKHYVQSVNDAVFAVVILGTVVGLFGLFMFRAATLGLVILIVGPPCATLIVHRLQWHLLPAGDSSAAAPAVRGEEHGAENRRFRWWRKCWQSLPNKLYSRTAEETLLDEAALRWEGDEGMKHLEMQDVNSSSSCLLPQNGDHDSQSDSSPTVAAMLTLPANLRDRQQV